MIGAIGSIIVDAFNICRNLDGNSPIWNILMLIGHAAYEGQIIRRIMKSRSSHLWSDWTDGVSVFPEMSFPADFDRNPFAIIAKHYCQLNFAGLSASILTFEHLCWCLAVVSSTAGFNPSSWEHGTCCNLNWSKYALWSLNTTVAQTHSKTHSVRWAGAGTGS